MISSQLCALGCSARERIDLLAYAMLFLPEDHPGLIDMLADKASAGCRMRIALANPDCQFVTDRGAEEGVPLDMRIRYSIRYFAPLADIDGIELHLHQTPLYASVFIADEQVFYTPHLYGLPGPYAPLFHVRQLGDDGIYAGLAGHVERVWEISEPWPGSTTTTTPTPRPRTA